MENGGIVYAVLLEDDERRVAAMRGVLARDWPDLVLQHFDDAPAMIAWLPEGLADARVLLLDHDLGPSRPAPSGGRFEPGDGRDVTAALATMEPCCPVLIHSTNTMAVPTMLEHLSAGGWTTRRVVPFSDLDWIEASWSPALRELLDARR